MANRYWVGGSGNWSDNTNHWSATSGGSPNASLPTSSDDVFVDSNSGISSGTITFDSGVIYTKDFTSTVGHAYSIDNSLKNFEVYGSLTLEPLFSFTGGGGVYGTEFFSTTTGKTVATNGATMGVGHYFNFIGLGGGWTLQSDLVLSAEFYVANGTFDANGHNITAGDFYFYADIGFTPTLIMGSGTWETSSDWAVQEENGMVVTINPGTSTIKMLNNNSENYFYQNTGITYGANIKTYNNIWITKNGSNLVDMTGSTVFNNFKIDAGAIYKVDKISATDLSNTITVSSFTAIGTLGNIITLDTYDGMGQFTLSSILGTINSNYLNITNSVARGGATWLAQNSVDGGNNNGWIFKTLPTPINEFFGTDY